MTAIVFECGHEVAGAVVSIANDAPAPGFTLTVGLDELPNMSLLIRCSREGSTCPWASRNRTLNHPLIKQALLVTLRGRNVCR